MCHATYHLATHRWASAAVNDLVGDVCRADNLATLVPVATRLLRMLFAECEYDWAGRLL